MARNKGYFISRSAVSFICPSNSTNTSRTVEFKFLHAEDRVGDLKPWQRAGERTRKTTDETKTFRRSSRKSKACLSGPGLTALFLFAPFFDCLDALMHAELEL